MALDHVDAFDAHFRRELARLRAGINTVPAEFREELQTAAELIAQQHERIRAGVRKIEGLVADIGLLVEHTKFEVAACRQETAP